MIEEKETSKTKIIIIIGIIILIITIGIIVWLLFLKGEKKDYNGTWFLGEVKTIDGYFKPATINQRIVITNNKDVVIYEDDIEKCKTTLGKKMVCANNIYSFIESESSNTLFLSDQNDYIYKYSSEKNDVSLKQGFSIDIKSWKIVDASDTIEYQSVEELNNLSKSFIEKTDSETILKIPINVKLSSPNDYVKYSFEIVNDGTKDLFIKERLFDISSDEYSIIDNISTNIGCYFDENHINYVYNKPLPFQSGDKLFCEFNIKNNAISNPTNVTISNSWTITEAN